MEDLLLMMIRAIVKNPDQVTVKSVKTDDTHVTLEIDASAADKGVIIGKGGRTIKALGDIVNIKGFEEGQRAYLKLVNNDQETSSETTEE